MSIKFTIRNTPDKALREGDLIVRYSGIAEPFKRTSERETRRIGVDGAGNPKLEFTTGLDEDKVDFYHWYNDQEKKVIKKTLKELRPIIVKNFGGEDGLDSRNTFFWKDDRSVSRLTLTNEDIDVFYDTARPIHALLYLSIISGAFMDLVAPHKEWAERNQIPHYLALETESNDLSDEIEITRSDAHAALGYLRHEQPEALYILAWCIQYDTNSFGAYNKSASNRDLVNYHIKYIDGKLQTKKKRNCPKTFIEYVDKWKGQQTRPELYTEAYVKAGEYYSFIQQREKKYVTNDGTVLGNTITEAVENLHKPKFIQDYEKLRDLVEAKWAE